MLSCFRQGSCLPERGMWRYPSGLTCRPNSCSDAPGLSNVVVVDRGSDPADEFDRLVPKLDLHAVEGVARAMASGREW